jgi:hypothetical protein
MAQVCKVVRELSLTYLCSFPLASNQGWTQQAEHPVLLFSTHAN